MPFCGNETRQNPPPQVAAYDAMPKIKPDSAELEARANAR